MQYVSQYHKAIFIQNRQNFNNNILETELLNLSNPEKSVVSAGKLVVVYGGKFKSGRLVQMQ